MFGQLAGLSCSMVKTLTLDITHKLLDITHKLFYQICSYLLFMSTIDFYHFIPLTDLGLAWCSQGQCKANLTGFIFSDTFHLIRIKFDVVMKQFKLNIWGYFWLRFPETRGIPAAFCFLFFFVTASKTFIVGVHLDVYKLIWFKLGMMIDTIVLYVLILV